MVQERLALKQKQINLSHSVNLNKYKRGKQQYFSSNGFGEKLFKFISMNEHSQSKLEQIRVEEVVKELNEKCDNVLEFTREMAPRYCLNEGFRRRASKIERG